MKKKAFTLIELLVGISISTILMISVGILITGGISNITTQKQKLSNTKNFISFQDKLNQIFFNIDTHFKPIILSSGAILKLNQSYNEGGFVYIGEISSPVNNNNGIYCLSGSENIDTKHIFIKTFIPDFDITIQKEQKILGVGKKIFGYTDIPKEGLELDKIFLNNPTGVTSSGTIDFFSDTLNNRILYKSGSKVYELLNEKDGIFEPTGLYYDNNSLYIANSGKNEILKYSTKKYSSIPNLYLTGITTTDNDFKIEFFNQDGEYNLDGTVSVSNFNFKNYLKQDGDEANIETIWGNNTNTIIYSFSGGNSVSFNDEDIIIYNLSDFSGTGAYYVKFSMGSFEKYYRYFIQSDDNLFTKEDNSLEIIEKDLNKYYTKINGIGSYDYFSDYNSYSNYDKNYDFILKTPIKSLNFSWDSTKEIFKMELKYYLRYNCYDFEDKIERNFIWIKNYK